MPEELRDLIARAEIAFNERDLAGWLALCTEDFEMHSRFSSVANTVFHGHDGVRQWWADLDEAWESLTIHLEDFVVQPGGAVLLWRLSGRGRGSGIQLDERTAHLWQIRDGKLASVDYLERAEAERLVAGRAK